MILLFTGVCVFENGAVKARPASQESGRVSSVYALAGEFRTVAANMLWMKADQYHHEFIERNPDWTKDTDMLGLLNIITDLDPRFVEAYSTAAVIYAYGSNDPRRACAYLKKGIAANPRAWDLHRMTALIYARRLHDPVSALPYARAAAKYCDSDFDKHVTARLQHTIEQTVADRMKNAPKAIR